QARIKLTQVEMRIALKDEVTRAFRIFDNFGKVAYRLAIIVGCKIQPAKEKVCLGEQTTVIGGMYDFKGIVCSDKSVLKTAFIEQKFSKRQVDLRLADFIIDGLRDGVGFMQRLNRIQGVLYHLIYKAQIHECRKYATGRTELFSKFVCTNRHLQSLVQIVLRLIQAGKATGHIRKSTDITDSSKNRLGFDKIMIGPGHIA